MPIPEAKPKPVSSGTRGPKPKCECGDCAICKNRLRQQRFAQRNRDKILSGLKVTQLEMNEELDD